MAAIGCEAVVHRDRSTVGNGSKGSSRLSRRDQPWADDELPGSASFAQSTAEPRSSTMCFPGFEITFHVMRRLQASRFFIAGGSAEPVFMLDGAVSE